MPGNCRTFCDQFIALSGIAQTQAPAPRDEAPAINLPSEFDTTICEDWGHRVSAEATPMLENAILSAIAPEAASAILYHGEDHAQELSGRLKLTALDLVDLHPVDRVVPEPLSAQAASGAMTAVLQRVLRVEVSRLTSTPIKTLLNRKAGQFRHVGQAGGRFRLVVRRPSTRNSEADHIAERAEAQAADGHTARV